MDWFRSTNSVQKECDERRRKQEEEARRDVGIDVDNYQSSGASQVHREKNEMHNRNQDEISAIKGHTQAKLNEIKDAAYLKKRELVSQGDRVKTKILRENELKKKQLEQEKEEKARQQSLRTDRLRQEQDEKVAEVDELKKQNLDEQINESVKTEVLRERLTDEQKDLNMKIDTEAEGMEKLTMDTHLALEQQLIDKEEADYQDQKQKKMAIFDRTVLDNKRLLATRLLQTDSDDLRSVDTDITNVKHLVGIIQDDYDPISEKIVKNMEKNVQEQALTNLEGVNNNLGKLSDKLTTMERNAMLVKDIEIKVILVDQVKTIKKKITDAKTSITDVKRTLRACPREFDEKKRVKLDKKIKAIISLVNEIDPMKSGNEEMKQVIGCDQVPVEPTPAIENQN